MENVIKNQHRKFENSSLFPKCLEKTTKFTFQYYFYGSATLLVFKIQKCFIR